MNRDDDEQVFRLGVHRLRERLIETMICEIDHPHVVVCRNRTTDRISLLGPYADGLAAVVAADAERRCADAEDAAGLVDYSVAVLDQREADA